MGPLLQYALISAEMENIKVIMANFVTMVILMIQTDALINVDKIKVGLVSRIRENNQIVVKYVGMD